MIHQIAEILAVRQAASGLTTISGSPQESDMLAPLSQILWSTQQRLVVDPSVGKSSPFDLGTLGAVIVSDDPRLLTLACALSH